MSLKFLGFALVLMLIVQVVNIGYTANSYNPVVDYKIVTSGQKIQLTRSRFDIVKNNAKKLLENKEIARLEEVKQRKAEEERKQRQIEEERKKEAEAKKQRELAEAAEAKKKEEQDKKAPVTSPSTPSSNLTGGKQDWMTAAGIPQSDWTYVDFIVTKESTWNPSAVNKSSGACGLAQALPCAKTGCASYSDPVCALKWQYSYVKAIYGGYAGAYAFWTKNRWY